jgi:hypothetical protein
MVALLGPMLEPVKAGELFLEKSPSHALFLDEILELLPKARIIHIVRDPEDVVATLLAAGESWGSGWAPRGTRRAAAMWAKHVGAVHVSAPRIPANQFFEVRYEDLHASPEAVLSSVAKFLGVVWSPEEVRLAVEGNTAGRAKAGDGTAIPVGGAFARTGGVVVEPAGFVRDGRPGGGRKSLSWWQKLVVRRYTRTALAASRRVRPVFEA